MIGYGEGVPDVKWIYVNGSQRNVTITHLSKCRMNELLQYVMSFMLLNILVFEAHWLSFPSCFCC